MPDPAEQAVSSFYNTIGWSVEDSITEDARRWEDLREHAREYVSNSRLRVLRHIPQQGDYILDMASGPIQSKEYLAYSRNFARRYCVDLSAAALQQAERRIGDHGVFLHGSFFDIALEANWFDCALSLHTIYHMDKDRQEEAVRKLLFVTKPGRPVIVVYGNPDNRLVWFLRSASGRLGRLKRLFSKPALGPAKAGTDWSSVYYHAYPVDWWNRFRDVADVRILPWRSLDSDTQKLVVPDNPVGRLMLRMLFALEDRFPAFFVRHGHYPMIVLTKRPAGAIAEPR